MKDCTNDQSLEFIVMAASQKSGQVAADALRYLADMLENGSVEYARGSITVRPYMEFGPRLSTSGRQAVEVKSDLYLVQKGNPGGEKPLEKRGENPR